MKAKLTAAVIVLLIIFTSLPFIIYLKVLPSAVSNPKVISFVQKSLKDSMGMELLVKNPELKTELSSVIAFKVDELSLTKDKDKLLDIKNLDTVLSFSRLLKQHIVLKKFGLDYIYADVNKLSSLAQPSKKPQKSSFALDWFNSLLYVKEAHIIYEVTDDTVLTINAKDLEITESRNPKFVRFHINADIKKGKENLHFELSDGNKVFIDKKKLYIDKSVLTVNNSKVFLSSVSDENGYYDVNVWADNFEIKNVVKLLESNLVIPNGKEMLSFFKDINGTFDMKIRFFDNKIKGNIKLNKAGLKVIMLNYLPITVTQGNVDITENLITLKDFQGIYNNRKNSTVKMNGTIKDYTKSCETEIIATAVATNEFSKKNLSKLIGYPVEIIGKAPVKLVYKSIYNKIDLSLMSKINKGDDLLAGGTSFSPTGYDRAVKADLHFENNILDIKSINYYIASEINKNSKLKPLVRIYGNFDCSAIEKTGYADMKNLGFEIPKPLPSEFLNVLIGQRLFKKGTIAGHLEVINEGKVPVLDGNLEMKGVRIPSQRLSVKEGSLTTDKKLINLNAYGRYKKSDYNFKGHILNEIKFPIIVKNVDLTVDNVDIERILTSFNNQNTTPAPTEVKAGSMLISAKNADKEAAADEENDDAVTFNAGVIIIEDAELNVVKGFYKDLKFGNLNAHMTLDKNGIFQVKSNRFDFAEGISSCKVYCDLQKHKYSVRLGVKDINSDLMATTLLALKREISGKASGLIELSTDDSLRLNGSLKFLVKNGTIGKIGYVEYALKFASLFRNPMAMISPSTLVDLVNIPEGNFDRIQGDLQIKDNIIEKIMIKSSSPQLSSFIVGRFDLENRDATLRIYTKFSNRNKGFAGFMRNISLNSLANRVPLSSRNDSNFYSAELKMLPPIEADERDCQVFLTKVDGDVEHNNFISSLKRIK